MSQNTMYLESVKILLIENTDDEASILQPQLSRACAPTFEVIHVQDLEHALPYLKEGSIDIVLLDLVLPDAKGFEGLMRIREIATTIPIIVLTEHEESMAVRAVQMGAQDYFVKGRLNSESLIHALLCSIERQRLRGQLQQYTREIQVGEARFRNLIVKNADGIIVVDHCGMVRFVNPAAETLLGRNAEDLMGESFGFPILGKEKTEIDLFWRGWAETGVAEMRLVETEWEGEKAYLISLRDITEHKKAEEHLQDIQQFNRSILDSLDSQIAVVNEQGVVITMNRHWEHFAQSKEDVLLQGICMGKNFFASCQSVFDPSSQLMEGIQEVLEGTRSFFETEYSHSPNREEARWFHIHISPLTNIRQRHLVVLHQEITARKRAARDEADMQASTVRIKAQEREIQGLLQLSNVSPSAITASMFGMLPLSRGSPHVFDELFRQYERMMDMAIEQRTYKVDHSLSDELRAMAERLGFLKAGPRDVIELHSKVLQKKGKETNPVKAQAYTEEGRLMVLELMGYLASYYRNQSMGISKTLLHERQNTDKSIEQEKQ